MNLFVALTDPQWFSFLAAQSDIDEVNFWQPGGHSQFRALQPGEFFLFKSRYPQNAIIGGATFAYSSILPLSYAWEAFGIKNGAASLDELRHIIGRHREGGLANAEDPKIGCIMLSQPFFFRDERFHAEGLWTGVQQGRRYDVGSPEGKYYYDEIKARIGAREILTAETAADAPRAYTSALLRPGQGIFRSMVADAYMRRCAVTGERVLPALQAAHIRPYAQSGPNSVNNGLFLRADIHALLDEGYVTISTDFRFEVSRRVREDYENGHDYYAFHGNLLSLPSDHLQRPSVQFIEWHNENCYKG